MSLNFEDQAVTMNEPVPAGSPGATEPGREAGAPVDSVHIPNSQGRALRVREGQSIIITDLEGGQIGDTWAFSEANLGEYLSDAHTRVATERLMPQVGDSFVTNHRRPILTFEEDASSGPHDFLIASCDSTRYASLGVKGWHPNCQENMVKALSAMGREPQVVPQPINFFQNTPFGPDGRLSWQPSITSAGDHVRLRAEMDLVLVVTACPQRAGAANQRHGPLQLDLR
ncbi:MAG TPA: urea carboxylase-associated family protein [Nocardioides sp.]|nr:urea carboxylase-associated family protein [Nocardioides sp.]